MKPERFDEMVEICRVLAKGIPFYGLIYYEINGFVYFSELPFFLVVGGCHIESLNMTGKLEICLIWREFVGSKIENNSIFESIDYYMHNARMKVEVI